MPDYNNSITVYYNRLNKSILLYALCYIVNLPIIMLLCVIRIRHNISKQFTFDLHKITFCYRPPPLGLFIADFTRP